MGFFKKLFGTAAVAGAAVGSALYVKKRKDERDSVVNEFEDFDDEKAFDINKNDAGQETKVTITINKRKVKNMADSAADKVINVTDKVKDTITEKVGEEKMDILKDKIDTAKDKISEVSDIAIDKVNDAKDKVVEKVGEENIEAAKDKVKDVASTAKEKVEETINKVIKKDDEFEDDFVDESAPETQEDVSAEDIETEDDVTIDEDDDEYLADELKDL